MVTVLLGIAASQVASLGTQIGHAIAFFLAPFISTSRTKVGEKVTREQPEIFHICRIGVDNTAKLKLEMIVAFA